MAKTTRINIRVSEYVKRMAKTKAKRDNCLRLTDWLINLIKKA